MKQILCFGDSNTYGLVPKSDERYPWGIRWTSLLNERLGVEHYRVIEEGLCGRATVFDDPLRDHRNGTKLLPAVLETHGSIDLVIVMLGTNDCKTVYGAAAEVIGKGVGRIIEQIRSYEKDSPILLISPIHLGTQVWKEEYDPEFSPASVEVSKRLADVYQKVAEEEHTYFLDASAYAKPSSIDQEHLDEEGHRLLAEAVYNYIKIINTKKP